MRDPTRTWPGFIEKIDIYRKLFTDILAFFWCGLISLCKNKVMVLAHKKPVPTNWNNYRMSTTKIIMSILA